MNFHIITLFPTTFDSYLNESIIARAIEDKKIKVSFYNPRDYSDDPSTRAAVPEQSTVHGKTEHGTGRSKWKRVDQKPYSGGPGMVIQALPVVKAVEAALKFIVNSHKSLGKKKKKNSLKTKNYKLKTKIIWLSPG